MHSKVLLSLFCAFTVILVVNFEIVESSPHSHPTETRNSTRADQKSKYPPKYAKISGAKGRESEVEEIEPTGEAEPGAGGGGKGGGSGRLPYFPSWNLPFEEFQTELDKIMEHINAGLQKVMEHAHDVVHEGLGALGGLEHDKAFITGLDPDLFKSKLAKYDKEVEERRRRKSGNTNKAQNATKY